MTFWKFVIRLIASMIAFEYGFHSLDLEVLNAGWQWTIGILIWIVYWLLMDVSDKVEN